MKRSVMVASALLLMTTAIGVAVASSEVSSLNPHRHERGNTLSHRTEQSLQVVGDRGGEREHHAGRHHGRRHNEDDDDDDDDGRRRSRLPQTGPTDPTAPVPDNGLFNNKARPKVEVQ